jgi:hypothetical protein
MEGEFTVTVGGGTTVTVAVAVSVQPPVSPMTVKLVELVGVRLMEDEVLPLLQEYVEAPVADNVVEVPEQTVTEVAVTTGEGRT